MWARWTLGQTEENILEILFPSVRKTESVGKGGTLLMTSLHHMPERCPLLYTQTLAPYMFQNIIKLHSAADMKAFTWSSTLRRRPERRAPVYSPISSEPSDLWKGVRIQKTLTVQLLEPSDPDLKLKRENGFNLELLQTYWLQPNFW